MKATISKSSAEFKHDFSFISKALQSSVMCSFNNGRFVFRDAAKIKTKNGTIKIKDSKDSSTIELKCL